MVTLIIGVPDSGKSQIAEDLAMKLAGEHRKYYIATMVPFGKTGQERIQKHRMQRDGKGFHTLECPLDVHTIVDQMEPDATVLLECMSNLLGNEIYAEKNQDVEPQELLEHVFVGVKSISKACANLVIVSNEFAMEDSNYDEETRYYASMMHEMNLKLRDIADDIYEFTEGEWKHHEVH
jgi:adenosylcobinamide kinase/adenosylcobinamide-phosphate guanylyltransferase